MLILTLALSLIAFKALRADFAAKQRGIGFRDAWWILSGQPGKQYPPEPRPKKPVLSLPSSRVGIWFYVKDYVSLDNAALIILSCAALKIWSDICSIISARV